VAANASWQIAGMNSVDASRGGTVTGSVPVVLVHGNPETPTVWGPVAELLDRSEVHQPNLPGFGCAVPDGFDATKQAYAAWLVRLIEQLGRPVHLVATTGVGRLPSGSPRPGPTCW
jgi:pimeloyl-ACP methyl ester carboxylesterase